MSAPERLAYSFAVLRAVPHVHLGSFVPVGVVLHARKADYLGIRVLTDEEELGRRVPDADVELLARYLKSCEAIARGDEAGGTIALSPPSERFHWLTSPRSDVIQCSPVHSGVTEDPEGELAGLWEGYVGGGG